MFLDAVKQIAKSKIEANHLLTVELQVQSELLHVFNNSIAFFQNNNLSTEQFQNLQVQNELEYESLEEESDSNENEEPENNTCTVFLWPDISQTIKGFVYNNIDGTVRDFSYSISDLYCPVKRQEVIELLENYRADMTNISHTDVMNLHNLLKNAENQF